MDEETSIGFDKEFKENLKFIRPYIIKLTNPKYITSCRVWLEKMSNCRPEEKAVRNEYLSELCRQIQNDKIVEPFINIPPEGPLLELGIPCSSNSWSDISTASTNTEVPGSGDCDTTENITPQDNSSYPNIYENKIKEQQMIIDELRQNNDFLKTELHECEVKMNSRNSKAEVGINMLATEVDYLKERLKELIIMKRNLQASHNAVIMQWEESTRNLETELQTEKEKCLVLEAKVKELTMNLEETQQGSTVSKQIEQKMFEAHHMEICNIQEKHSEVIKYIEDKHSQLIQSKEIEHEQAVRELKKSYDQRIEQIAAEAEKNCKFRDEEIARLEKLIEMQCDRDKQEAVFNRSQIDQDCTYTNDSLVEKISFLQNCILKMERLLRKYEKHYGKKVSFLTKELQMKENTLQIQLTTQRAQLLAKASSERQIEIEDIVTQLEERYRSLLEDQQAQVTDIRQEYTNLISKLSEKFDVKAIKSA